MSLFNKTAVSLSVGTTKIDAVIELQNIIPGSHIPVNIQVNGGVEQQEINTMTIALCCQYIDEYDSPQQECKERIRKTHVLASWQLPYPFTLTGKAQRTFDITLPLPLNTPITLGDAKVWLDGSMDNKAGFEPQGKEQLTIRPDPLQDAIFDALEFEGLRIRNVECEAVSGFALPFVQEFEFVPVAGPFHGLWREIELVSYRDESEIHLWFEVDRQLKGMKGMLSSLVNRNEAHYHLSIPAKSSPQQAAQQVVDFLHHNL